MATHTTYYNLTKPSANDKVNIGVLNDNADIIDTALHNKVDSDDLTASNVMMSDGVTSVEDAMDGLTADTGWVHIGTGDTYYRKIGKIVYVRTITPAPVQSSWTTIDTLPVGYRPASIMNFCLYESSTLTANIKVFDTGEIKYVCNVQSASMAIYISFVADN